MLNHFPYMICNRTSLTFEVIGQFCDFGGHFTLPNPACCLFLYIKVLLEHSHKHSFTYHLWLLLHCNQRADRVHRAQKA